MSFILLYVTNPDKKTARRISEKLLKKKMIACANILPVESVYWWKGRVAREKEVITILKTRKELKKKVEAEIIKLHPYSIPCIVCLPITANKSYENWVRRITR